MCHRIQGSACRVTALLASCLVSMPCVDGTQLCCGSACTCSTHAPRILLSSCPRVLVSSPLVRLSSCPCHRHLASHRLHDLRHHLLHVHWCHWCRDIVVVGTDFASYQSAVCSIRSLGNNFVDQAYSSTGYNCMKTLPATIINATHLTCRTLRVNNAAPANLTIVFASTKGGKATISTSTVTTNGLEMMFRPYFDWAVGRRPYVYETTGSIIFKPDVDAAGTKLKISGRLEPHWDGNVSSFLSNEYRAQQTLKETCAWRVYKCLRCLNHTLQRGSSLATNHWHVL